MPGIVDDTQIQIKQYTTYNICMFSFIIIWIHIKKTKKKNNNK